jgi:hypothetical protein
MKQIKVYTKGENTPVSTNKYYEKIHLPIRS